MKRMRELKEQKEQKKQKRKTLLEVLKGSAICACTKQVA